MPTLTPTRSIVLTHDHGAVTVVPADQDRFVMASDAAVTALRDADERQATRDRFRDSVLLPLREWCEARPGRVLACYVRLFPTADHLRVYVFGAGPAYDFALAREVSALELSIHRAGWRVLVRQLTSAQSPSDLFNPDQAIQVFAHPAIAAHAESGTAPHPG